MRRAGLIAGVLALVCMIAVARAETPKIDGLFPAGGKVGHEFDVALAGTIDPWPIRASANHPGITVTAHEKEKGTCRVSISAEVAPGAYLIWFYNDDGASAPRQFVVGVAEELEQKGSEPLSVNRDQLPLTINGKLETAGDVDRFSMRLAKDDVIVAEVTSYAIDAPLDPILHVRGERGEQLAFNHDGTRMGLDPRLTFRAPADGTYEFQLSAFAYPPQANIRFAGGATSIYRVALRRGGAPSRRVPDDEGSDARVLDLPARLQGAITRAGEIDRFKFTAGKGDVLRLEVDAARLGSWMDAVLVIRDHDGKELKRMDDIDSKTHHDVALDWTAPADGEFTVEVFDLYSRGGEDTYYELRISKPGPAMEVSAAGGVFAVKAGAQSELAVKVTRRYGLKEELEVGVDGLPAGVTAAIAPVSEKGEARLVIEAAPDAARSGGAINVWCRPRGESDAARRVSCQFDLKGTTTDAGDLLVNQTGRGWLTVLPKE